MKLLSKCIITASFLTAVSCAPKKPIMQVPTTAPTIAAPKLEPQGNLVPFTREAFFKLRDAGIDVKRLKFFVDKGIVLNKSNNTENMEVDANGTLIVKKGIGDNTISILPSTAGMIESVEADGVRVNFGRPNSSLKFINNTASPKFFTFLPDKTDKTTNTNEVNYNGGLYKATSDGGMSLNEVKLLYKQLDIELNTGKGTVEPGVGGRGSLF